MKRTIPLLITSVGGIILILSFFIPFAQEWGETVAVWFDILAGIAFILGGGNLLKTQLKKISDRKPGWGYAGVTVVAFLATLYVGIAKVGVPPNEQYPDKAWSGDYQAEGTPFWWAYEYGFRPLVATMFAMLAFYVASAAFRAFRAKNLEATLLLGTAFIILLGRTYAGVWLTSPLPDDSPLRLETFSDTIRDVFTTIGTRAIMIGVALGIASTSLKIILGVDRSYLGARE
ncbi:MAG TPA: hypothetical protein VMS30_10595 [Phycisphaerales bacterium]|jgi:hypothetical protein|nr:hypothetical protein [Phycisphaerales bacterium]